MEKDKLLAGLEEARKRFNERRESSNIGTFKGLKELLRKKKEGATSEPETNGKGSDRSSDRIYRN